MTKKIKKTSKSAPSSRSRGKADARRTPKGPLARILVATDFSKGARLAVQRAAHLPLTSGAKVVLLHVLQEGATTAARDHAEAELVKLAALVATTGQKAGHQDLAVRGQLATGGFEQIILTARKFRAELILLGRHGQTRLRDMLLGTTAERVLRKGGIPTLVVSDLARGPYMRPLLAVDLGDAAQEILACGRRIAGDGVRSIPVVHAYHVPFESRLGQGSDTAAKEHRSHYHEKAKAGLLELLAAQGDDGPEWIPVLHKADARIAILAESVKRRSDLIVVGTHARSGPVRVLLGSVASRVAQAAGCDVLVLPPGQISFLAT